MMNNRSFSFFIPLIYTAFLSTPGPTNPFAICLLLSVFWN